MPRVIVVMPTYNRAQYIAESIESVLNQTYTDFRLVVVDDGSTDDTASIVQHYGGRVIYIRQVNSGPSAARNRGALAYDSEFVALHDSDDIWMPSKLTKQIEVMDRYPNVGLVCTNAEHFTGKPPTLEIDGIFSVDKSVVIEDVYAKLFRGYSIPLPSAVLRRTAFDGVGGFDPELRTSEDWDLWLKVAKHYEIARIQVTLLLIRRHEGNNVWADAFEAAKRILAKNPPKADRISNPEEAVNTALACYCLLTLVGKTLLLNRSENQLLLQEWRNYYSVSKEPAEAWLQLLSSAFVDALNCGVLSECPGNKTIADFASRLFDDPAITVKAEAAVQESFAWFYARKSKRDSARHAWSAIAKTPRLFSNRGLLKLAFGIGNTASGTPPVHLGHSNEV